MSEIIELIKASSPFIQLGVLITAIIAVFQTNKSIKNTRETLELAKQDSELNKKQLNATLKCDFEIVFEEFSFYKNDNNIYDIKKNLESEYQAAIKNISVNNAKEVVLNNFLYLSEDSLNQFEIEKGKSNKYYQREFIQLNTLKPGTEGNFTFTYFVKEFLRLSSQGKVESSPILYLKINYKNALNNNETIVLKFNHIGQLEGSLESSKWVQTEVSIEEYNLKYKDLKDRLNAI
ncbi:hypothetical protein K2V56_05990 [Staphylococcus chromogenes]|uniref:hypothetical protein n=1 Tax=Staphylococcus chromogenes TaxID=46126 RepID=UPI001E2CC000|nr:hypothetical protein [Staphylococcus chromogenes]MCD8905022.1 hypothetical protein [Staphylococcus chromogenes]